MQKKTIISMYNLTEISDSYSKISRSLLQHCKDESGINNNSAITEFPINNNENEI